MTEKAGTKSSIKAPPPPAAVELDAGNFNEIALDSTKNVLVAFTAPWVSLVLSQHLRRELKLIR